MRLIDEVTLAALSGSRSGDELICWVWYDGALALPEPLPISDWSLDWDGGAKARVQGRLRLTVKDPDGLLAPWLFDDPLGIGGSRIQVFYQVGGAEAVKMGWYRIDGNVSEESWQFRVIREDGYLDPASDLPAGYRMLASPTGASVNVEAGDLTVEIESDEFVAPEQPAGSIPTVQSELERLVGDTVPITYTNFSNTDVPKDVVWDSGRMEAVMDLLDLAGAWFRMSADGELEAYTKSPVPVLEIAGGEWGISINLRRAMDVQDFYNVGVVESSYKESQTIQGRVQEVEIPVYGYYEISAGPLRAGGPFGRRVVKAQNPLMNSQLKADAAAKTMVLNRLAAQRVNVEVTCLPNPALQVGDAVTVVAPLVDGRVVPLVGEVVKMGLSGGAAVNPMSLTVSCLNSDVTAVLRGFSIEGLLTGPSEARSWATINPQRTWEQMNLTWDDMKGDTDG